MTAPAPLSSTPARRPGCPSPLPGWSPAVRRGPTSVLPWARRGTWTGTGTATWSSARPGTTTEGRCSSTPARRPACLLLPPGRSRATRSMPNSAMRWGRRGMWTEMGTATSSPERPPTTPERRTRGGPTSIAAARPAPSLPAGRWRGIRSMPTWAARWARQGTWTGTATVMSSSVCRPTTAVTWGRGRLVSTLAARPVSRPSRTGRSKGGIPAMGWGTRWGRRGT